MEVLDEVFESEQSVVFQEVKTEHTLLKFVMVATLGE